MRRVAVPYHACFYAPLALLHASLLVRLAGDWMLSPGWRAWDGMLNGVALVAFVLGTIAAVIRGKVGRQAGLCSAQPMRRFPRYLSIATIQSAGARRPERLSENKSLTIRLWRSSPRHAAQVINRLD